MEIIKYPNEILKKPCELVKTPLSEEDRNILTEMYRLLKETKSGVGLAAPQVGITKALIVVRIKDEKGKLFSLKLANPRILKVGTAKYKVPGGEICLSEPDIKAVEVERHKVILLTGYDDITGKYISMKLKNFVAAVIQHEFDHLNGILLHDYMKGE